MVTRFVGSGRQREGGRAAVHRQDFRAHTTGGDWRHKATQIDMNPQLAAPFNSSSIQGTLESIVSVVSTVGQGFITIGDGYDVGDITVGDPGVPSIKEAFEAAFVHPRIANDGGVILVKAGTYRLTDTVDVPPGFTILGESRGTVISGDMTLPTSSMFRIQRALDDTDIGASNTLDRPIDTTRFINLVIADNIDGYSGLEPTVEDVPLITCELQSHLECDYVSFIGRVGTGGGARPNITRSAIGGYATGGAGGSSLRIKNCYIDGVGVGVEFTPSRNINDVLVIDSNRARTFGRVNTTAPENNTFCNFTVCNATLTNNYIVGADSNVLTAFNYSTASSFPSGSDLTKTIATGNSGGPLGGPNNDTGVLLRRPTGFGTTKIIHASAGNSYGLPVNTWTIVVGAASGNTAEQPGSDISGSDALEFLLNNATYNNSSATIILQTGTHTLTSVPNYGVTTTAYAPTIIGSKVGNNYPVINMALTSGTTNTISQASVILGNVQSIIFSNTTGTGKGVILTPTNRSTGGQAADMGLRCKAEDCLFIDTTLLTFDGSGSTFLEAANSTTVKLEYVVEDCQFQNDSMTDNFHMLLSDAHSVIVRNCYYTGPGYIGGIGALGGYSNLSGPLSITLENCVMDLTGDTINADSPSGSGDNHYFIIDSPNANVNMTNCYIYSDNTLLSSSPVAAGLLTAGTFDRFITLTSRTLHMENCEIVGPDQQYTNGTQFAIPALFLDVRSHISMDGTKVHGALPMQVSGSSLTVEPVKGLDMSSSGLYGFATGSVLTCLDVDMSSSSGSFPSVNIADCQINNRANLAGFTPYDVEHFNNTGSYSSRGAVQLSRDEAINMSFTGNSVVATIDDASSYDAVSGLAFETFFGSRGSSAFISDNRFLMTNRHSSVSMDGYATGIFISTPFFNIHDNYILMNNLDGTGIAPTSCVVLDAIPEGTSGFGSAVVQGNTFDRGVNNLREGFVVIKSTSERGSLIDNKFTSPTRDGVSTNIIRDFSSEGWFIERNINQTKTITLNHASAQYGINLGASGVPTHIGDLGALSIGSSITSFGVTTNPATATSTLNYSDTTSDIDFFLFFDLAASLPNDVRIVSAQAAAISSTGTFSTTGNFTSTLASANGTDVSSTIDFTSVGSGTAIATASDPDDYNTATDRPALMVRFFGNSGTIETVAVGTIIITYRW